MIERFGKRLVCYYCAAATNSRCSGCDRPVCAKDFGMHRCPLQDVHRSTSCDAGMHHFCQPRGKGAGCDFHDHCHKRCGCDCHQ